MKQGKELLDFPFNQRSINVSCRAACAIPAENEMVIITGGGYADIRKMKIVSVYNVDGWQRDLTPMNVGRRMHACSSYVKGGKKVFVLMDVVFISPFTADKGQILCPKSFRLPPIIQFH